MPIADKSARSAATYEWSATAVGEPGQWPLPLRLASGLLFNSPLPTLLAWGSEPVLLQNEAYAALAGTRAPGGVAPPLLPPPLALAPEAFERARHGEAVLERACALAFPGSPGQAYDLYFTPVPDETGAVRGVLCAIAPGAAVGDAPEDSGALRILVVEDNLDSQYLVCEMLKAFGHEAEGVAHPADALERLAAARFDVLFSDVSLPGMSGVDLARQAVQGQPGLKVIFASGYGDTLLRHLDFPYQSLQKPYELEQLQRALDAVSRR